MYSKNRSCRGFATLVALTMCVQLASAKDSSPGSEGEIDIGEPFSISDQYKPGDDFMSVRLLGAVRIKTRAVKGEKPRELSGLAWDEDENMLIAISDDGLIAHLKPEMLNGMLTDVSLAGVFPLKSADGTPLDKSLTDAEGLVGKNQANGVSGDTVLNISFEQSPRIDQYTLEGDYLGTHELPVVLRARENYAGDNQELEALAEHPEYGLLTAPERPLRSSSTKFFTIYGLNGHVWHYPSLDHEHSALVGMDVMPNGNLLVLERRFASMFQPIVFALRELNLGGSKNEEAKLVREVIKFSSTDGWKIDNFESVAYHKNDRYFVISDDNESVFQKTLLVYLEIKPLAGSELAGGY